jgi:hypothetical protein
MVDEAMIESAREKAREEVRKALELYHPELRVGLISDKDALKLACCIEVLVEEVLREKLAASLEGTDS